MRHDAFIRIVFVDEDVVGGFVRRGVPDAERLHARDEGGEPVGQRGGEEDVARCEGGGVRL